MLCSRIGRLIHRDKRGGGIGWGQREVLHAELYYHMGTQMQVLSAEFYYYYQPCGLKLPGSIVEVFCALLCYHRTPVGWNPPEIAKVTPTVALLCPCTEGLWKGHWWHAKRPQRGHRWTLMRYRKRYRGDTNGYNRQDSIMWESFKGLKAIILQQPIWASKWNSFTPWYFLKISREWGGCLRLYQTTRRADFTRV